MRVAIIVLTIAGLMACQSAAVAPVRGAATSLDQVGAYKAYDKGAEIVSVQSATRQMAVAYSDQAEVHILDLSQPAQPALVKKIPLSTEDEALNSVSFHPVKPLIAAALAHQDPRQPGRVVLVNTDTGRMVSSLTVGYHPDAVLFTHDGATLLVANEGEQYLYDSATKTLYSQPGSVSIIDTATYEVQSITMDFAPVEGMTTSEDRRYLEREVLVLGDVAGLELKQQAQVVSMDALPSALDKTEGQRVELELPLLNQSAAQYEPEYIAITPDNRYGLFSMQENNAVAVLDIANARWQRIIGLGVTEHKADTEDNGVVSFDADLRALREPDGLCVSPDGRYVVTADEGDTDPKASKLAAGQVAGGGCTISVFDLSSGELIADTGAALDRMAHQAGVYPEGRSDNKGSEPESVACLSVDGAFLIIAALERADALALLRFDGQALQLMDIYPIQGDARKHAPEGLAYLHTEQGVYLYAANEKSGLVAVFSVSREYTAAARRGAY